MQDQALALLVERLEVVRRIAAGGEVGSYIVKGVAIPVAADPWRRKLQAIEVTLHALLKFFDPDLAGEVLIRLRQAGRGVIDLLAGASGLFDRIEPERGAADPRRRKLQAIERTLGAAAHRLSPHIPAELLIPLREAHRGVSDLLAGTRGLLDRTEPKPNRVPDRIADAKVIGRVTGVMGLFVAAGDSLPAAGARVAAALRAAGYRLPHPRREVTRASIMKIFRDIEKFRSTPADERPKGVQAVRNAFRESGIKATAHLAPRAAAHEILRTTLADYVVAEQPDDPPACVT